MFPIANASSQSTAVVKTPEGVVNNLDAVLQARFLRTMGEFGLARMTLLPGHDDVRMRLGGASKEEGALWDAAVAAKLPFEIGFIHCAKPPATATIERFGGKRRTYSKEEVEAKSRYELAHPNRVTPILLNASHKRTTSMAIAPETWVEKSKTALPKLMKGEPVNVSTGDTLYAMRPIKALKNECLGCHTNSKAGDTLGALLYVVSKTLATASASAKLR
jgi:hypothetical protein